MKITVTAPTIYPDHQVAACYVCRDLCPPKRVIVNVDQAVMYYPESERDVAIKTLAEKIFLFMESMDIQRKQNTQFPFTGYD